MKQSLLFGKTAKNTREIASKNAYLLEKGGYISQEMAGVYTYLPLGLRVLEKIERIIREEMNKIASEILMPSLSPVSSWEKTGRLDTVDVLFKTLAANAKGLKKNDHEYILNSTHEEVVTPLSKKYYLSYKDFPVAVYQIQTKFRNEPRAKSGLMRCREFLMKDLYSFHASEADLKTYYEIVKKHYWNILNRLGLGKDTLLTLASGGDFTKDFSHEFQTKCVSGEDLIFYLPAKKIAYNREIAPSQAPKIETDKVQAPMKEVKGEGIIGVEALAKFLHIRVEDTTKTLLFETETGTVVAAAVRGGYDVNEEKLIKVIGCKKLTLARPEVVVKVTGAAVGYAGLLNLPKSVTVIMDESMRDRNNFEMGANKTNYHCINVNFGRDLPTPAEFYDIKTAREGDISPETGETYLVYRASEVANIFPLGTKFSQAFDYRYLDKNGKSQFVQMGCYGMGPSRIMGVLVEKFYDQSGIKWPKSVSPYQVHLIGLNLDNSEVEKRVESVYRRLVESGIEVLYDDRADETAGSKLADSDLIGIPVRLIISKKTGENVEWRDRDSGKSNLISLDECINKLADFYSKS